MENESNSKNYNDNLKEVVYIPLSKEKSEAPLLQLQNKDKSKDSLFLYISACMANVLAFVSGCSMAWSSPAFVKLKSTDANINPLGEAVTSLEESWIASLICLGAAVGPIFAGKAADSIGRKKTLIVLALPILTAYMILTFATKIILFYIARFLSGLCVGGTFAIVPMYLAEITQDHNRGKFGCLMTVFVTLGVLYPFAVGPFLSLKVFCFSCAIPLMLFLILFSLFIPDSPVFLLSIGKKKEAEEALSWLRNSNNVEKELLEMKKEIENEKGNKQGVRVLFKEPNLRKGLIISASLVLLQQFSGINAVMSFLGQIFDASGSGISTYTSTTSVGMIQVIATFITSVTVEKLGRKFLLLLSCVGSCTSILILGLYFYLEKSKIYNVESLFWLPIVSLIVYIITFNMGLGPIPWAVMGEIFPANVKSAASAITCIFGFLGAFGVTLGFPILSASFGMAQCFWLFGFFCIIGIIFIYFVVPETKGKTLSEIQEILGKK